MSNILSASSNTKNLMFCSPIVPSLTNCFNLPGVPAEFWGVAIQKNRKKNNLNLKFALAFGFFPVSFGSLWYFFGFFFRSELRQEIPAIQKSCQDEVLRDKGLPNNTLNAYKALQMSYKSYYNQQEPLNKNPLGGGQPEKRRKKTMSILGFYKGGSFFFDLNFIWV